MNYKYKTMSQSQLGKLFGVSSHVIGKWLVDVGLRSVRKRPTWDAHQEGFCESAPSGQSGFHWIWNSERTVRRLVDAGHDLVIAPPEELVLTSPLVGPFRILESNECDILSGDGAIAVRAASPKTAEVVLRLLNLAYKGGPLDRFLTTSRKKA
jgi:hypothetical protein